MCIPCVDDQLEVYRKSVDSDIVDHLSESLDAVSESTTQMHFTHSSRSVAQSGSSLSRALQWHQLPRLQKQGI